ncbi:MAG: proprotein convertase P-domain-containing protein [Gemmataceae bacterium]
MSLPLWTRWLRSLSRRPRGKTIRNRPLPVSRRPRPSLEGLEDRTLFAVLPAALVSSQTTMQVPLGTTTTNIAGFSPTVIQDPINPNKVFAFYATQTGRLGATYSTDGGDTWTGYLNTDTVNNPGNDQYLNLTDPNLATWSNVGTTGQPRFTVVTNVSATWDRQGNIYVVAIQRDAANTSGALVFYQFSFTGAAPGARTLYTPVVLERWVGADPICNPVVAVDNNLPTYTDPLTGITQTDTLADTTSRLIPPVYVAWNTNNTAPSGNLAYPNFNPNVIKVVASGAVDGTGLRIFSTSQFVSDLQAATWRGQTYWSGNVALPPGGQMVPVRYTAPKIAFTQGTADGSVVGGQLIFVWNDFGNNNIRLDNTQPDGGLATNKVVDTVIVAGSTTNISGFGNRVTDAAAPASGSFDIPGNSAFQATVALNSTFIVGDLDVTLNLTHPNLSQLNIVLVSPGGKRIRLLYNRMTGDGKEDGRNAFNDKFGVPDNADSVGLGVVNADRDHGFSQQIGTVFDEDAARFINDAGATAPYVAHFRPEGSNPFYGADTLDSFNGLAGDSPDVSGTWQLEITDYKTDGTNPAPFQRLDSWSLHFTSTDIQRNDGAGSHVVPPATITAGKRFGTDRIIGANRDSTSAGAAQAPYPQANTGPYGPGGVASNVSVAMDNTLGSFSPYQGRLYIAYTKTDIYPTATQVANPNVYLISVDGLSPTTTIGSTVNAAVKVNDDFRDITGDGIDDNPYEGNRAQFSPTVAVDQTTGTVGVMYYDGRWDAARARVANSFSASIDGGDTFSDSTFFNTPKEATDALTHEVITLEPVPGNQGQTGTINGTGFSAGFGDRQGLLMYAGHVLPVFSSNENAVGLAIKTAHVTLAAGPRLIYGDMGPITTNRTTDGTPQLTGFEVDLDRPIDVTSFTPGQVVVEYRNTVTSPAPAPATQVFTGSSDLTVTPLDASANWGNGVNNGRSVIAVAITNGGTGYSLGNTITITGGTTVNGAGNRVVLTVTAIGPGGTITGVSITNPGLYTGAPVTPSQGNVNTGPGTGALFTLTFSTRLATRFWVGFVTPQTGIGTYSYAITPVANGIKDLIRTANPTTYATVSIGNRVDQNQDATTASGASTVLHITSMALGYDATLLDFDIPLPKGGVGYKPGDILTLQGGTRWAG